MLQCISICIQILSKPLNASYISESTNKIKNQNTSPLTQSEEFRLRLHKFLALAALGYNECEIDKNMALALPEKCLSFE